MPYRSEDEMIKAVARLPGLDIEIHHRPSPDGHAEEININLRATPSFEAFGQMLDTFNPFAVWASFARLAFLPWMLAASALAPERLLPPASR